MIIDNELINVGVVNVVTSSRAHTAEVGQVLCQSPKVAGISFTGSTNVSFIILILILSLKLFFIPNNHFNLHVFIGHSK